MTLLIPGDRGSVPARSYSPRLPIPHTKATFASGDISCHSSPVRSTGERPAEPTTVHAASHMTSTRPPNTETTSGLLINLALLAATDSTAARARAGSGAAPTVAVASARAAGQAAAAGVVAVGRALGTRGALVIEMALARLAGRVGLPDDLALAAPARAGLRLVLAAHQLAQVPDIGRQLAVGLHVLEDHAPPLAVLVHGSDLVLREIRRCRC